MAQDDIQGQVVDPSGNPVSGAIVELTKSFESNPVEEQTVLRTTTDSNGNYIFEFHPDGDGTTQDYHVSCYNHDGSAYVNSFNNPGVTADLPSNVIPDSVVYYYPFEERSNNTITESVRGDDATANGTSNVSGTWLDGYAEEGDGIDDYINLGRLGEFWPGEINEFSFRLTIQSSTTNPNVICGANDGNQRFRIVSNVDSNILTDSGNVYLYIDDTNGNATSISFDTGTQNVFDGNKHRVVFIFDDFDQGTGRMALDGSEVTDLVGNSAASVSALTSIGVDVTLFARNLTSGTQDYFPGIIDNPVIDGKALTTQEIQEDYNNQPWS